MKKIVEKPCYSLQAIFARNKSYLLFILRLTRQLASGKTSAIAFHLLGIIFLFTTVAGCLFNKEVHLSGRTMGTTYNIKIVTGYFEAVSDLQEKIDRRLKEINMSMSTYERDSDISRFNSMTSVHERFYVSEDFFYVMKAAEKLYRLSKGAWDGTIKPLVNLWGFGNTATKHNIPQKAEIDRLLSDIGFGHIEISNDRYLRKKKASVSLDLASIAKGYAVDQISKLIRENGFTDFLVEIGGEVFASGYNKNGTPWRVGINWPAGDAASNRVYKVVLLHNRSLATSGDYRNFFEINGKRYSHVINPLTGYPVDNGVASVSITADTCTYADGLATAAMVMGHIKGIELIESLDNVEALFILKPPNGDLVDYYSKGFTVVK